MNFFHQWGAKLLFLINFRKVVTFEILRSLLAKILDLENAYINIHQDVIDACKAGDRNAQFRIYKLYYKAMYNTSLRIVNDTMEAEDIMQESFLQAFRRIESYTGEGSFGSWLKRIVTNKSLDAIRKRKNTVSIEDDNLEFPDIAEENREEEIVLQVAVVKEAIAELPEEYRIIITLFLIERYSHEEISGMLNISNNLSRTRLVRAKQKVLKILKEKKLRSSFNYN
jgi:RNA polymerase sigma-70 factor (ECF subfamily)